MPLTRQGRHAGQSLTEFALVVPVLVIVLLLVTDFGRLFAAGITLESAARTSAEVAAQEYIRAPSPIDGAGYASLHQYAWQSVCDESQHLANIVSASPGTECSGIPTAVCVHDGADPDCGTVYNAGSGGVPSQCTSLQAGSLPSNAKTVVSGNGESSVYVEVRVCYRFSTIIDVSIPSIGGVLPSLSGTWYLQRSRTFTVADY